MTNKRIIQKKPNLFIYTLAGALILLIGKIKWGLKYKGIKPKGPAIVISNHTSNIDWIVEAGLTWPQPMTFLITYHFFTFKFLGFLLTKLVRAIPKYQFATDLASIRKIKSVLHDNKGLVYIAPEGTVWGSGKLGYIASSICKMIKMMKVPVYASKIRGAGLGCAKWSKHLHKTKIETDTSLLFTESDTQKMTNDEMHKKIIQALNYNEFEYQKEIKLTSKDKDLAEKFETLFFICPCCKSEFTLVSEHNTITCTKCKTQVIFKNNYRFSWKGKKKYFDNYTQWYDWQLGIMKKIVSQPNFSFSEEVDYGIDIPGVNNYKKVGHGIMTVSHSGWDYVGTFNGEQISEHDDTKQVILATLKIGLHFELPYRFNHCRVFYPQNGLHAAKWHIISRAITETAEEI